MPPHPKKKEGVSEVALAIRKLRESRGETQTAFAHSLQGELGGRMKVVPASVSKWEAGRNRPFPQVLAKMGELAVGDLKSFFLREAGVESDEVSINLYRSAGAGSFRFVDEEAFDTISFPRRLLTSTRKLVGLIVEGDSMSPIIRSGFIVIVDRTKRTPEQAKDQIIAASDDGGVAIRMLQLRGGAFWLVPQNLDGHAPSPVTPTTRIVGVVIKWIGQP